MAMAGQANLVYIKFLADYHSSYPINGYVIHSILSFDKKEILVN